MTLVNANKSSAREVVVQGGAYAEHTIESVRTVSQVFSIDGPSFRVTLAPGAGTSLTLQMKRYAEKPTEAFPEGLR